MRIFVGWRKIDGVKRQTAKNCNMILFDESEHRIGLHHVLTKLPSDRNKTYNTRTTIGSNCFL